MDTTKFIEWLEQRDCEILPTKGRYEAVRWKGRKVAILYVTGKTSCGYAYSATIAFKHNGAWEGFGANMSECVLYGVKFKSLEIENTIIDKENLLAEGFAKNAVSKSEVFKYIKLHAIEPRRRNIHQHYDKQTSMYQWKCELKTIY